MRRKSVPEFVSWTASTLLLVMCLGCVKGPVQEMALEPGAVISGLYKVSGTVQGQSLRGLRAALQLDADRTFLITLLTPMNQPVAALSFDGQTALLVDYQNRVAYRDRTSPYHFHGILQLDLDLAELMDFYREYLEKPREQARRYEWGRALVNQHGQLIGLMNDGATLMFTPLSSTGKTAGTSIPALTVPEGYAVYETDSDYQFRQDQPDAAGR